MAAENHSYKWLRTLFWCAAVVLGAVDTWATRNTMNPDGISYLDMGDAYWRGDWHMAVNAYWSPLYSWLTGLALKLLKPSAYWEYPVVHLVNFVIYLGALGSFEFLMRAFIDYRRRSGKSPSEDSEATLPEWAWWTLGYSLFIWTSLVLISTRFVTPDMCVAAVVYLASGLLLRMRRGTATRRTFVLLGVVLGFGYLAKAVMFPLAFVFLAVALFSLGSVRKAVKPVLISALVFLAIASPLIAAISRAKGRPTFGESGREDYEVFVDGADLFLPSSGTLTHPVRKIFEVPPTHEFAEPIGGTYPIWYDPSYWHEGLKPYFDLRGQVRVITDGLLHYCWLFFSPFLQLNISAGLFILLLVAPRPSLCLKRTAAHWSLFVPALSALGLYSLVVVDYRFIGAFVCLLWLAAFSGVRLPASRGSRRLIAGVVIAMAATTGVSAVWWTLQRANAKNADPVYGKAALALVEKGIRAGDKVAVIADEPWGEGGAFVARLARIRIIAQVNPPGSFWAASSSTQSQVIEALAKTGAKAILTLGQPPLSTTETRWQRLGNTRYFTYLPQNEVKSGLRLQCLSQIE